MSTHFTTLFLGFPRPIYFFFTSFYSHGLVAELLGPPFQALLLYLYLLLLLWAYWPLFMSCQPILPLYSLGFLGPIYFFFTSFYTFGLTTSFLGHHQPIYFFFTSCYFHGPTGYQSCHSSPLGLFPYFFTILPLIFFLSFLLLDFFYCQALCQNGHQQHVQCM